MPAATPLLQVLIAVAAVAGVVAGIIKLLGGRIVVEMDKRFDTFVNSISELRNSHSESEKEAMQRHQDLLKAHENLRTTVYRDFVQKGDLDKRLEGMERKLDRIENRIDTAIARGVQV